MVGMESGMSTLPILILGCARVVAARQERIWTRALTGSVSGVLQAHGGLEFIKEGFHDESFAQQHLIQQGHQIVFHVTANAGDQVKAPLPEALR